MKYLLLLFLLFSCSEDTTYEKYGITTVERLSFVYYVNGHLQGRLLYDRANQETKYQWIIEARDSYLTEMGNLTKQEADVLVEEWTNSWGEKND